MLRFSKAKWLEYADAQKQEGHLSQREIDDACTIWVNDLDGKSKAELITEGKADGLRDEYFVEG